MGQGHLSFPSGLLPRTQSHGTSPDEGRKEAVTCGSDHSMVPKSGWKKASFVPDDKHKNVISKSKRSFVLNISELLKCSLLKNFHLLEGKNTDRS